MIRYVKCPRCELNYIDADKQEMCDVCLAEVKGNKLQFADLDDEEIDAIVEGESGEQLCPVCGVNFVAFGEKTCEACKQKAEYEQEDEVDPDRDEEWKSYLDEDSEDLTLEDAELDKELKEELEEEMQEDEEEEEEFYEDVDPLDDYDEDFEGDDEDDDDDDDDDDDLF